jgi:DAK2 domain fusion protein YloV
MMSGRSPRRSDGEAASHDHRPPTPSQRTSLMADPSIERFRRVVRAAYTQLEARRQEVNDLNVFPVADGDTGDNMALTLRALLDELDRLDGQMVDEIGRSELVNALARAALMGARGNSGVILSQIVRGAAEELASRPGELVDPVLVAASMARAAEAAYDSVREPAEGTMLTVFREMAHSVSRRLAHMERARLNGEVTPEEQDELLATLLEEVVRDGERAVDRTPEQLEVLSEAGVVDAGAYGLVVILAGVVAGLRGDAEATPEVAHHAPARVGRPHHEDSRFRYCTNFIVIGSHLDGRAYVGALEELGDSVLVVGDDVTLKVHVHTDHPERAMDLFEEAGEVSQLDVADMREQIAERTARLEAGGCAIVAVVSGAGLRELYESMGALVVDGGPTFNPSISDLLAAIHDAPSEEVLVLPNNRNVVMAAERAAELSDKQALVAECLAPQAGVVAMVELDPSSPLSLNAERIATALAQVTVGSVAPAARDDAQGRFVKGDAVGFVGEELVAWGGAGSTLAETISRLADGAEILTVIGGTGAPLTLEDAGALAPEGIEVEAHEGGQPNYWWLLASQ